jgi:signal transduction histidine kinase
MLCTDTLLQIELFQTLPIGKLEWICDRVQSIQLRAGDILSREGDRPDGFYIQVSGTINLSRNSQGIDMPIGRHEGLSFIGEIQVLSDDDVPVTIEAACEVQIYRLSAEDFLDVLHSCREFEKLMFRTVQKRIRGLESFIQTREKMAALGTLSAGLAHELNNPAAALVRALKDLQPAMLELQRMNLIYGQRQVDEAHTDEWLKIRDSGFVAIANPSTNPLELSDREDRLLEWLEDYGVQEAWKLVEPLALGGVEPEMLSPMMEPWRDDSTELRDLGLRWLALSFDVMAMIRNGLNGAERISTLVHSMKSYSYMDRGAQQKIDIHEGIEDTLRLFSFKLKQGIIVKREYSQDLSQILAFGSELNQVWTNLIDNAIYELENKGTFDGSPATITIRTCRKDKCVVVEIVDNGIGISPDVKNRILEPFFTTKPMGKGSGLGLDVVRRIIENRHQGSLAIESGSGKTCFIVFLPIQDAE